MKGLIQAIILSIHPYLKFHKRNDKSWDCLKFLAIWNKWENKKQGKKKEKKQNKIKQSRQKVQREQ